MNADLLSSPAAWLETAVPEVQVPGAANYERWWREHGQPIADAVDRAGVVWRAFEEPRIAPVCRRRRRLVACRGTHRLLLDRLRDGATPDEIDHWTLRLERLLAQDRADREASMEEVFRDLAAFAARTLNGVGTQLAEHRSE